MNKVSFEKSLLATNRNFFDFFGENCVFVNIGLRKNGVFGKSGHLSRFWPKIPAQYLDNYAEFAYNESSNDERVCCVE